MPGSLLRFDAEGGKRVGGIGGVDQAGVDVEFFCFMLLFTFCF